MNRLLRSSLVALPLLVCTLPGLIGCGPGQKDRAVVKGTVTIDGKALNAGTVTFTTKDNRTGSATIGPDGTYEMGDAPQGDVTITVSVQGPTENMMGPGGQGFENKMPVAPGGKDSKMPMPDMRVPVPIPPKYADVEKSGLNYKVGKGSQTKNIELTR